MARPITLTAPVRDPRLELAEKLREAPLEHAEALLEALELLQQLHNREILSNARDLIAAGDTLAAHGAGVLETPESASALRNAVILGKMFAAIDPRVLHGFAQAMTETKAATESTEEPPSLLSLLGQFRQKEVRRSISLLSRFLAALGTHLRPGPDRRQIAASHPNHSGLQPASSR